MCAEEEKKSRSERIPLCGRPELQGNSLESNVNPDPLGVARNKVSDPVNQGLVNIQTDKSVKVLNCPGQVQAIGCFASHQKGFFTSSAFGQAAKHLQVTKYQCSCLNLAFKTIQAFSLEYVLIVGIKYPGMAHV